MTAHRARAALAALFLVVLSNNAARAEDLPAAGADLRRTSVSGLSSGAYMAGQFQIAHSETVIGAGLVAGGPYGCANTPGGSLNPFWAVVVALNVERALSRCMNDGSFFTGIPGADELADQAQRLADDGRIDSLQGLAADKVYLFSGAEDETVERAVVERAAEFYARLGVPAANVTFIKHDKAAHAFITQDGGLACGTGGEPFINDCDYDQAKAVLEAIYGPLPAAPGETSGRTIVFAQSAYAPAGDSGLAEEGVAFIPETCARQAGCAVHVVFHGCKQGRPAVGDTFIKTSGYQRWAGAGRLILVFPQIEANTINPNGCWDWWGYTGRDFLTREAPQIAAVRRMLARLAETR